MSDSIIPDIFAKWIRQDLERQREAMNAWHDWFPISEPTPLTPEQKARREWVEQRETEAFRLAPWLKDQLEEERF